MNMKKFCRRIGEITRFEKFSKILFGGGRKVLGEVVLQHRHNKLVLSTIRAPKHVPTILKGALNLMMLSNMFFQDALWNTFLWASFAHKFFCRSGLSRSIWKCPKIIKIISRGDEFLWNSVSMGKNINSSLRGDARIKLVKSYVQPQKLIFLGTF